MHKSITLFAAAIASACASLAPFTAAFAETVVVRPGDTLALIAERELGNESRYREVCELNLEKLRHDCNFITVGMVLTLPPRGNAPQAAAQSSSSPGPSPRESRVQTGDYSASFGRFGHDSLGVNEGYKVVLADDYAELSGYVADASAGGKPGIWLQLPASVEKEVSGRLILVKAMVRMRRTPGPIALAYSTAEVGNSGWITKGAGTDFRTVSFTYLVPEMKAGNGDYIGILPDPRSVGQVLHLAAIAVEVLEE